MAYPKDYCCIVTRTSDIWFCKKCRKAHNRLYVNNKNKEHFCSNCVPPFIKKISTNINENGEII